MFNLKLRIHIGGLSVDYSRLTNKNNTTKCTNRPIISYVHVALDTRFPFEMYPYPVAALDLNFVWAR